VDRDGTFSPGDTLLPGVSVTITGPGGNQTVISDDNGNYNFGSLAAGRYTITVTTPDGYLPGHSAAGTFGGTPGENTVVGLTTVAGQSSTGYNFGMELPRPR
jgi:hypothetical protein